MKDKLRKFMMGRYGVDELNRFMMMLTMVFVVLDLVIQSSFLYLGGVLCLVLCYFRMLSRNINKRYQENQKYLRYEFRVRETFRGWKIGFGQRKTHHIYKCPKCGQKIRVPRGKGKIKIHCPKCNTDFIKNS